MAEDKNKHLAVWQWLYQNEDIKRLFFNFSDTQNGNITIATNPASDALKVYLNGDKLKAYDFSLIQYMPLNTVDVNSEENAEIMFDAEKLMEWIEEQEENKNYPYFKGCVVVKVENMPNMPAISGMDDTVAKYLFGCRITYLEPKR